MKFKNLIFFAILILLPAAFANAQEVQENQTNERQNIRPQRLFEQLGLSREQIQQIRRINRDKQPLMREAQDKLREANRALDAAIYADTPNEEEIKNRLKNVQTAHAEVLRIRTVMEFEVRKVLTAEQLAKFRQLREEFEKNRQERQTNKENRPNIRRNN
jgi:periplasmic protein CpxP/Spy